MTAQVDISAQMIIPGISVQIREYYWRAGDHVATCEHDFIVSYRPCPTQISVGPRLPQGAVQKFGQLMFFPADVEIKTGPANISERVRNIWCRFDPDWMIRIWKKIPLWDGDNLLRCLDIRNASIEQALQRMGSEVVSPGFASTLLIESLSTMVAVEMARYFSGGGSQFRVRTREGKLSHSDFSRIVEYIDSVENRCPTMEDISNVCDISAAHLRRAFKKTTGKTLHQYADAIRVKKAQSLLADTDLPLKEIAYRMGFGSTTTFSSTFRRWTSETPSGYRYRFRGALN